MSRAIFPCSSTDRSWRPRSRRSSRPPSCAGSWRRTSRRSRGSRGSARPTSSPATPSASETWSWPGWPSSSRARDAQLYRGKILSRDGGHLLVIAELKGSATDAAYSRAIPPLIDALAERLNGRQTGGARFTLTPAGAYRAALDNENAARRDMRTAILLTTLGIALLLVITFPRPLIGLLALLPSTAGAVFALLVCSFFFPSLSILAVSFGGAIMAFTVDLGITYLLFLDRPCEVSGRQAAREVQSGEILAALTTIGAFLLLLLSRFQRPGRDRPLLRPWGWPSPTPSSTGSSPGSFPSCRRP